MTALAKKLKTGNEEVWNQFELVLLANSDVFPEKFICKELFLNIYGQVLTRCFEFAGDQAALVPMADMMNHSPTDISNEVINLKLHLEAENQPDYYRASKMMNDYSAVF